jgi:hypothetical protein
MAMAMTTSASVKAEYCLLGSKVFDKVRRIGLRSEAMDIPNFFA